MRNSILVSTRRLAAAAVVALVAALGTSPAQAVPFSVDFGPASSFDNGADFSFDLAVPTTILGDATLFLTLDGDFNTSDENATISLDGFSLGTVADNNPANDAFDFANDDNPDSNSGSGNPFSGTAIISNADIAALLADGILTVLIETPYAVNASTTTVSGSFSFETGEAEVSEPGALGLLALGLLASGGILRRRNRRRI